MSLKDAVLEDRAHAMVRCWEHEFGFGPAGRDGLSTTEHLEEIGDVVVYYHIETEGHRVVLANGAPAEPFVDYVTRRLLDNYAEFEALYGTEETVEEMELRRVSAVRQMPAELRERFGLVLPEITFTSEAA